MFLKYSPLKKFRVKEYSMDPYLKNNDAVVVFRYLFSRPKVGDVIIFHHTTPPHMFIKRITKMNKKKVWVEGDNKKNSIDSRTFGFIDQRNIIGKVIKVL